METKVNYAAVGVFVLTLGAMMVGVVLWLASGGGFQKKYDPYLAIFDESVSGLNFNAPVKYRGVDVGKVKEIALDTTNPELVRIVFAIERGVPIKEDTVATLKTQGLTGIAYVELSGGTRASPPLTATAQGILPEIRTKASLSARLETLLTTLMGKLDSTSSSINALLGEENQAAFKSALADLATVAHTIAGRKDAIDKGISNAARLLDSGARVTAALGPVIDKVGPAIDKLGRSADAVKAMGDEAARASASAGKTVETIGADVKRFTSETLPELERLLGELSVLSTSLRRLSDQTQRNPSGLLFGRKSVPPGPGEASGAQP